MPALDRHTIGPSIIASARCFESDCGINCVANIASDHDVIDLIAHRVGGATVIDEDTRMSIGVVTESPNWG